MVQTYMMRWYLMSALLLAMLPWSSSGASEQVYRQVDSLLERGFVTEARKRLDQNFNAIAGDYELLWRMSRVHVLQGDMQSQGPEQEKFYYEARRYADLAVAKRADGMWGYVRRAAASGKVALFKGVLSVREMVISVKEDAEKAISLANAGPNALASAHYILGRTHSTLSETAKAKRMLVGLGWGNMGDALSHLKRATEIRPGFITYMLDYAKALIAADRKSEAATILKSIAQARYQEFGDDKRIQEAAAIMSGL